MPVPPPFPFLVALPVLPPDHLVVFYLYTDYLLVFASAFPLTFGGASPTEDVLALSVGQSSSLLRAHPRTPMRTQAYARVHAHTHTHTHTHTHMGGQC